MPKVITEGDYCMASEFYADLMETKHRAMKLSEWDPDSRVETRRCDIEQLAAFVVVAKNASVFAALQASPFSSGNLDIKISWPMADICGSCQ